MVDLMLKTALVLASSAVVLVTWRLFKGPDAPNRAVALDVLTLITMPLMVGLAVYVKRAIYLDVALVYGMLSFLCVVALARYYDRGI